MILTYFSLTINPEYGSIRRIRHARNKNIYTIVCLITKIKSKTRLTAKCTLHKTQLSLYINLLKLMNRIMILC